MVLEGDMLLTTYEMSILPQTPEFVFINCCYSSKNVLHHTKFHKFAANIGTQLINAGVKVVVAAGWAIDNDAAIIFAKELYKSLFEGIAFGEAVKIARAATYQDNKTSNTWGAYQCYGDPFYQLIN